MNKFTLADCRSRYVDKHTKASSYNSIILKDFIKTVAFDINKAEDDSNSAEETIIVYWKQFTADWHYSHIQKHHNFSD